MSLFLCIQTYTAASAANVTPWCGKWLHKLNLTLILLYLLLIFSYYLPPLFLFHPSKAYPSQHAGHPPFQNKQEHTKRCSVLIMMILLTMIHRCRMFTLELVPLTFQSIFSLICWEYVQTSVRENQKAISQLSTITHPSSCLYCSNSAEWR